MGRSILLADPAASMTEKVMIVLTDGHHNTGTDPLAAATRAAGDGITIHTITFGWYADKVLMGQVAAITGGSTHHAPDGTALSEIFRDLALNRKTILTQ